MTKTTIESAPLYPDWLEEHKHDPGLPRRINEMYTLYGKTPGKTCKGCKHLLRFKQGARWSKCSLSKMTSSAATDWRAGWSACGKYIEGIGE